MSKKRILIADDEPDLLMIVSYALERENWETVKVGSGEEALSRLKNDLPYHLVILDYLLPDPNGLEIAKYIKSENNLCHVPIILCTGSDDSIFHQEIKRIGIEKLIIKPFDLVQFRKTVEELMH